MAEPIILTEPTEVIPELPKSKGSRTHKSLAPTTTAEEDVVTKGQRKVNLIWEFTQATIATLITVSVIYCAIDEIDNTVLNNALF